jgi:hypothetical protein
VREAREVAEAPVEQAIEPVVAEKAEPVKSVKIGGKMQKMVVIAPRRWKGMRTRLMKKTLELKALKQQVKKLQRFKEKRARRLIPKGEMVVAASLFQSIGVSARSVPKVMAVASRLFLGDVVGSDLISPNSALTYSNIMGVVAEKRLLKEVQNGQIFGVAFDSSSRGPFQGLTVTVVSHSDRGGIPTCDFLRFGNLAGHGAEQLADALVTEICGLQGQPQNKAHCVGFCTDGPNVMVGAETGVGVRVVEALGVFVRHDICELHASASVARVLESIWPPRVHVCSVTQFVYLGWYLCNWDWELLRAHLLSFPDKGDLDDVLVALEKFGLEENGEFAAKKRFREQCLKPEKPATHRFGTVPRALGFLFLYFKPMQFAVEQLRMSATEVEAGMCMEFLRWSGSPKLLALLEMACEFCEVWKFYDDMINLPEEHYGVPGSNKVLSRPKRSFDFYRRIESILVDIQALPSFAAAVEAFGEDRREEVNLLYRQLYLMAKERILHNYGRYFRGVYLYGGFGDPEFALVVWEVFSTKKKHSCRPKTLSAEAKKLSELESLVSLTQISEKEKTFLAALTTKKELDAVYQLLTPLRKQEVDVSAFVDGIRSGKSFAAQTLCSWVVLLSTTQSAESGFRMWDTRGGASKNKASSATGASSGLQSVESRVRSSTVLARNEKEVLATAKKEKKRARAEAKSDIASAVSNAFAEMLPEDEEIAAAREKVQARRDFSARPLHGISDEMEAVCAAIEKGFEDFVPTRSWKTKEVLFQEGLQLEVEIRVVCVADCLKPVGQKGRPLATMACRECERDFHIKCMKEFCFVAQNWDEAKCKSERFLCESCGGVPLPAAPKETELQKKKQKKKKPNSNNNSVILDDDDIGSDLNEEQEASFLKLVSERPGRRGYKQGQSLRAKKKNAKNRKRN